MVRTKEPSRHRSSAGWKEEITCALDQPYELAQAFKNAPHVALMNLSCDQEWAKFVARWGPLQMSDHERRQRRSRMQLDRCRAFQRFRSYGRLLDCFRRMDLEGEKLREFLKAAEEESRCWRLGLPTPATTAFFIALQHEHAALELSRTTSMRRARAVLESVHCGKNGVGVSQALHR